MNCDECFYKEMYKLQQERNDKKVKQILEDMRETSLRLKTAIKKFRRMV